MNSPVEDAGDVLSRVGVCRSRRSVGYTTIKDISRGVLGRG